MESENFKNFKLLRSWIFEGHKCKAIIFKTHVTSITVEQYNTVIAHYFLIGHMDRVQG